MRDRVVGGDFCKNSEISYLRVFTDLPGAWHVDGCSDDGKVSEACWELPSFQEAIDNLRGFAQDNAPHLL